MHVWNDPWVPNLPGFRPAMLHNTNLQVTWVSDLFVHGQRIWNMELLPQDQVEVFSQIYIPHDEDIQDNLMWLKTSSGLCTSKSCYKLLYDNIPTNLMMAEFPWKNFLKKVQTQPKIHNFLWKVLRDGIVVYTNLSKYNPQVQNLCPLCNTAEESIFHLLFNSQFALEVYQSSPFFIEVHGKNRMEIINHWLAYPDQGIMLNLGSCLMWNIWKVRNELVFNNNHVTVSTRIHKTLEDFRVFDLHHALNYWSGIPVMQNDIAVCELPPPSFVKINVDAAYNNGKGVVATVAVDTFSNHMGSGAICFDTFSSTVAEAKAYVFGIQLEKRLQLSRIIVEGDAYEIPKAVTWNTNEIPWILRTTVLSIRDSIKDFSEIKFVAILRDVNSIAHELVQYAISNFINKWWYHDEPLNCIMQRLTFSED